MCVYLSDEGEGEEIVVEGGEDKIVKGVINFYVLEI